MKQIFCKFPNGECKKFGSATEAARYFNVSQTSMQSWLKGKSKPMVNTKAYQCTFQYMEVDNNLVDVQYITDEKTKGIKNCVENIITYLVINYDAFQYNEMTDMLEVDGKPITDKFIDDLCVKMEKSIQINNDKKTRQAITNLCLQSSYHPLKEKIESFEWDGTPRIEEFFIKFVGAHDTPLNRFYTKCWFKAAIKRLYEPGCMWDSMIILYDKTGGTGKTKIFERLGMGYSTKDPDVSTKDSINVMNNAWIVNFDELSVFDKKGMNMLKNFITTRFEVNRLAYARYAEKFDRHCIFCGTTNEQYFLRDYTSERERRFWVINCSGTPRDDKWWKENLPDEYIEQLWAEAKRWYDEDPNVDTSMSIQLKDDERLVQLSHKSSGKDPEFEIMLREALDNKYSKMALEHFNLFKKEIFSPEIDNSRIFSLDKIEVKKLAAVFRKAENYTEIVIASLGGWLIRDGYAIRTSQYQMEL